MDKVIQWDSFALPNILQKQLSFNSAWLRISGLMIGH